MLKITACVISLNEEDNISRCLKSLSFVDEIILVDSGSTDQTISIAEEFSKVRIFYRKFDTYINQKNYCIDKSSNEWVLSLDADEEVSEELKLEILSIQLKDLKGFFIPRLTFYMNQWIKYGGWYPNYQLRFFHKDSGKFSGHLVHETVEVEGRIEYLKNPLKHYSYKNISDHLQFIDKYSELHAFEKHRKGKKSGVTIAILEAIWKFLSMYILRLGFLDGKVGLIIAILGSYYNFLKYIKVYELNSQSNKKKTLIEVEKAAPIEILKES